MESLGHSLEEGLQAIVALLKLSLEGISVFCIFLGLVATLKLALKQLRKTRDFPFLEVRLKFGYWLALALEFQLGADILGTTITPSFKALGQLGAIAIIRTFLNYFLNKELETEIKMQELRLK
jgi:uncharacterized membrane protein